MNSRTKGHGFERWCCERLREVFPDVHTSRFVGALWWDQCGVDLVETPGFNVQCKAKERTVPYHDILEFMPQGGNTNIIIHKRNNKGCIVALRLDDFLKLIQNEH